jgi:hypothetical protein
MAFQLPEELQNITGINPTDSGAPRLPYDGPLNPNANNAAPEAPDLGSGIPTPAPGTFAAKLGAALANPQTQQAASSQRGGWAKAILGGVMDSLGDAAHATDVKGGGWLSGIESTLQARGQRIASAKQRDIENKQRQQGLDREDQIAKAQIAQAQTNTLVAQQTLRHNDAEDKRTSLASDQNIANDLDSVNTPVVGTAANSDDLTQWYAAHPELRGKVSVTMDKLTPEKKADGTDFLRPSYKIYGEIPEMPLTAQSAAYLSKYDPSGQTFMPDTKLPGSDYIRMMKTAHVAEALDLQRQKLVSEINKNAGEGAKAAQSALDDKTKNEYSIAIAPEMAHQNVHGDPILALSELSKSKDPAAVDMSRKITAYYGGDVIARLSEAKMKEAGENVRHAADLAQRTSDARQTAGLNQILKDTEKVGDVLKQNDSAKRNIAAAKSGDELASQMVPLMTALGVSTFAGVHRINQTEIDSAGPQVGSYYRRLNNLLDKAGKGTLSPDSLKEANDIFDRLNATAYDHYSSQQAFTAAQRGLPDSTLILDRDGINTTTIGDVKKQRMAAALPPPQAGTINIQDSKGGFHNIPANQLETARKRDPQLQVIQ